MVQVNPRVKQGGVSDRENRKRLYTVAHGGIHPFEKYPMTYNVGTLESRKKKCIHAK